VNKFSLWYRSQPAAIRFLLTVNVVIYVVYQLVLAHFAPTFFFFRNVLALNPELPGILAQPWQIITYNFLHLGSGFWGLIHIVFNMLWLIWVGREFEEMQGSYRLFALYMLGGIGGGLLTVLLHNLFPGVPGFGGPVQGASGAVLGVLMGVAVMYPHKSIALLLFGVVRLLYVVLAFLAINLLFMGGGGTSVSAHFGGALFGFIFAWTDARGIDLSAWAKLFFPQRSYGSRSSKSGVVGRMQGWVTSRSPRKEKAPVGEPARIKQVARAAEEAPVSDLQHRVDKILDKINEHGAESLTDEERQVLIDASKRR
jgi:membrane associated rhomboid family serine protease